MNLTLQTAPDLLFYVAYAIVGVGWLALIFFPRRHVANFWVAGVIIPSILGLLYTVLMLVYWFQPPSLGVRGFMSLPNVYAMFGNSGLLLAAFVDILLLSLIAGAWVTRKAAQTRMPYVYLFPILLLMIAFPGTGIVVFYVVSAFGGRVAAISELENVPPASSRPVSATPAPAR